MPLKQTLLKVSQTRSQAVARIADRSVSQCFGIMLRHRSRDHLTAHMPFPIGSPLGPNLYLYFRDIQRQM